MLKLITCTGLCLIFCFCKLTDVPKNISIETKQTKSGNHYSIIYKNTCKMDFVVGKRPDQNDKNIILSIAGAFTDLNTNKVDGIYMSNGIAGNTTKKNSTLGGAIKLINGDCEIFPSKKGALLNDSLINLLSPKKAAFFQQIQMIENGAAAKFKDVKLFQRRGIAKFKNGKTAIIESDEAITLKAFADDLVELGVNNLLYTDMGAWDEGWCRDPVKGSVVVTGKNELKQQDRVIG